MRRRTIVVTSLVAAAGLCGFIAIDRAFSDRGRTFAVAAREDIVTGAEIKGELMARENESLGTPQLLNVWRFQISQLVAEGAQVRKGDVVVAFDTAELTRELQENQAEADSARKQIEKRRADLTLERETESLRLEEMRARLRKAELKTETPSDVIAIRELEEARADAALATRQISYLEARIGSIERAADEELLILQGKLDRAVAKIAELETSIEAMSVRATRDGIAVMVVDPWEGTRKKVGDNAWRGQKIVEIPDLATIKARGTIDEAESGKIRTGQLVTMRLDAHPDVEIRGRIDYVGDGVRRESPAVPLKVLPVEMSLARTDPGIMKPGMRLRGQVEIERVTGAVTVPLDAVFDSAEGPVVHVRGLFGTRPVRVELGRRNREKIQILDGVEPGDRVVVQSDQQSKESSS